MGVQTIVVVNFRWLTGIVVARAASFAGQNSMGVQTIVVVNFRWLTGIVVARATSFA